MGIAVAVAVTPSAGLPQQNARDQVRPTVEAILGDWRTGPRDRDATPGQPVTADTT